MPQRPQAGQVSLALADDFAELCFHVLAHVRRAGPGDLFDAAHVAWSRSVLGAAAQRQLEADAAVLAALWEAAPALDVLDALAEMHRSIAAFRRTAGRALAEVRADEVAEPGLLRALQGLGAAGEVVHAALGLLARPFAEVHARAIAPRLGASAPAIAAALEELAPHVPGLAGARIELALALGRRGRAMPERIVIGPGPHAAIVAAHEVAVCSSGQVDHARAEWAALGRLARWLRGAPGPLREAHAAWLAGLELAGLVEDAIAAGRVAAGPGRRVVRERAARADALAELAE